MCKICDSIYGHLDSCPDHSPRSDTYCISCECEIENGEPMVVFPKGNVFCKDCVSCLDMHDLCLYLDVDNPFELIQEYGICEITRAGRYQ